MLASEIIRSLPDSLDWMVLFDLSTLRRLVADEVVRGMFYLPESTDLDPHSHVVLTSQGTLTAAREGSRLTDPIGEAVFSEGEAEASLYGRFSDRFGLFSVDDADCLAIGETPPFPPVLLHLRAEAGYGEARAVFAGEPSGQNYELLKAIGVEYLGGSREGSHYVARFRNHLPTHIHAGILARFSRTNHCNLFFLRHGSIDEQLEKGLVEASTSRVSWAAEQAREAVVRLASEATDKELALTCQPPPPAKPFASGDVVPLGFLLKALNYHTSAASIFSNVGIRKRLMSLLQHRRQELLWPQGVGGSVSSTATALVLQGFHDPEGIEALEGFADGQGGYYPRLRADERALGKAVAGDNGYRRQPDFATTCLVRALRSDAELDTQTSVEYLASRFQSRSGLYFANPYMVDWALASALKKDESAQEPRDLLATEILASMNDDYSFGFFDVPTSSAFAILSLAALGHRDRTLRIAQLRLLDFMQPDGAFPSGTPFYSARAVKQQERVPVGISARGDGGEQQRQVIGVDRELYEVSLYFDGRKAISTAVATLALLAECSPTVRDSDSVEERWGEAHPRYGCRDHAEYVRRFALPPYSDGSRRV